MLRKRMKALALILALGLWPAGARAAPGLAPAPVRATSGGGWVDRSGFGELVYRSMLEGYLVGTGAGIALVDPLAGSSVVRVGLGGVLGISAGLALPLLLSRGEVRSGDVALMGAAHGLGMMNGMFIPLTVQLLPCSPGSPPGTCVVFASVDQVRFNVLMSVGLSLAAGGLAVYFGPGLSLSPGQAEALGSAAFWGGVAGFLLGNAISPVDGTPSLSLGAMVAMADAAVVSALLLRDFFEMDRSRIWFIDLAVVVGGATGLALAYFINPSLTNHTGVSIAILGGSAAGWVVGYSATGGLDGYKQSAPPERAAVHLGSPTIRPLASMTRGERAVGVQVDVLQGRF